MLCIAPSRSLGKGCPAIAIFSFNSLKIWGKTKLFADVNEHLKEMMTQLIASKEVADGLGRK